MQSVATGEEIGTRESADIRVERAQVEYPDDAFALIEEYYEAVSVVARDDRAMLLGYLSDPRSAIWVAYCDGVPMGCILYHPLPQLHAGEMKRLYVRKEYRGLGVARQLLHTLEHFAREQQIAWLYLDTKDDLTNAIAFYRRHGYQSCTRYNDNPQATVFMRKRLCDEVMVRRFEPGDEEAFRKLNEAWIQKYFRLEEKDHETLNDPGSNILARGGEIFMALRNGERVGCCALLALGGGSWEIAKMAVAEEARRQGIGRQLLEYAIGYAKARSSRRLYLETNSALQNAIHLYKAVGFREVPPERLKPSPYARANVFMEMMLA
jgi:putative acetyltransferase